MADFITKQQKADIEYAEKTSAASFLEKLQKYTGITAKLYVAYHPVDAVPVTRCKDCKYGDYDSKPDGAMVCLRTKDGFWRQETDFCSFGVRKDEGENE